MDDTSQITVLKIKNWSQKIPNKNALFFKRDNYLQSVTWHEYYQQILAVGKSLFASGFNFQDKAIIVSNNCPEWVYSQFGINAAGGVSTALYVTDNPSQYQNLINHSDSKFVFAQNEEIYKKLFSIKEALPNIKKIIVFEDFQNRDPNWSISFKDFLKLGSKVNPLEIEKRIYKLSPDDPACFIYTSGTTASPRAVICSHANFHYVGEALIKRFPVKNPRLISYLPLCHSSEQAMTNITQLAKGGEVYFCPDVNELKDYLQLAKPNIFMGVPRVWEKVQASLQQAFLETKGTFKGKLLDWARKIELEAYLKENKSKKIEVSFKRKLANKLVLSKIKRKLGVDLVEVPAVGAAPMNRGTAEFFGSIGIRILNGFGMTENTGPAITCLKGNYNEIFSVGFPLEGIKFKIAEDGELLLRGQSMTKGYYKDPEATKELWKDNWLHTGDIAKMLEDGSLRITDRKKNIIVNAGGKNILPAPIEDLLMSISGVEHAVVVGDQMPFLSALITVNQNELSSEDANKLTNYLNDHIGKSVNPNVPRYQRIKKFHILSNSFSIEKGELTPTLKVKRNFIIKKYQSDINYCFENGSTVNL